ncbi:hypothetical protein V2O64_06945 [Verrucomicrobiaceae bacterium 227]
MNSLFSIHANPLKRILITALTIHCSSSTILHADEETVLFDNHPESVDWSTTYYIFPHAGDRFSAQPFKTGELGMVSSVSFPLARIGSPVGIVHLELWNDLDGVPEQRVASLGDIDLASLKTIDEGGELLTFNEPVTDLIPKSIYHLVSDLTDATFDDGKTYATPTTTESAGTRDAGCHLVTAPIDWVCVSEFVPSAKYNRMRILEKIETPSDSPQITRFTRTRDIIMIDWNSKPGATYTVEFNESLSEDNWIEIAEDLSATTSSHQYQDHDPDRLNLEKGFYRVREVE